MPADNIKLIHQPTTDKHVHPFPKPNLGAFETPLRIQMALRYLQNEGVLKNLVKSSAPKAKLEEALHVHSSYLVHTVEIMSELGGGELGEYAYASPDLLRSVLHALGGALRAASLVVMDKAKHAFALVRPPGHHATSSSPMGLCYFNNVAVAVRSLIRNHGVERVSILDIDSHHGNGTAEIFYSDPNVQYISVHEYDYENFGIGHYDEIGHGDGLGTNVNIPLVESSPDISYRMAIEQVMAPAVENFRPDIVAVSAGYDAHYADPVGNMDVDSRTFWLLGSTVEKLVQTLGLKGSFWVLEGGYNPLALGPCVHGTVEGLLGKRQPTLDDQTERKEHKLLMNANKQVIEQVLETHSPFL
ncbi:MAG: histone deacetylase [Candidatus Thorarchaeota archaeon]